MNFVFLLIICVVVNTIVYYSVMMFVPNYYLASMIISIIIAFIYAIFSTPGDRKGMFKSKDFYVRLFFSATLFLVFDAISFLLG